MALGYISISIFLLGCVSLILSALLLVRPMARISKIGWQRTLLSYICAILIAWLTWSAITWVSPGWVKLGIGLFVLMLTTGLVTDIISLASSRRSTLRNIIWGNFSRSLMMVVLGMLTAVTLGRTAIEVGLTNNMPLLRRTATQYDLVIKFEGQEHPARFLKVEERGLHLWVPRHEIMPVFTPYLSGQRYSYPKVDANLPFNIYMTGDASLFREWGRVKTPASMAHTFGNIAVVYCPAGTKSCFRSRPEVKEHLDAAYGTQLSGKGIPELFFRAAIPEIEGQNPIEFTFSFKNVQSRPVGAGPFSNIPEVSNVWLLNAWDWFPQDREGNCNKLGLIGEWRLCYIDNDTWDIIRKNQAKKHSSR